MRDATVLRLPKIADAAEMLRIVQESGVLEPNSCYAYLLLCTHFADTCVVAERDGAVCGFVAAYVLPGRPDTVFVWQVGVAASARRRGLAKRMLGEVVGRDACRAVAYLESTVAPSNDASRRLFRAFGEAHGAECRTQPGFTAADFGGGAHEDEHLFRIGPLNGKDQ